MTAGPHRDRSSRPQTAAATGTNGIAIRYPMSVASPAGRSPPASLATMIPTWTSSRISRTPTAASRGTFIRWFWAVISSAYPASARPATMIVVETAPFTQVMLLRFVVTGAGPSVRPLDRGLPLPLFRFVATLASDTAWTTAPVTASAGSSESTSPPRPRAWPGSPETGPQQEVTADQIGPFGNARVTDTDVPDAAPITAVRARLSNEPGRSWPPLVQSSAAYRPYVY